jgi:VIT1/CCC1 family predicted Fe2+/Mn2+ transporter
MDWAVVSIFVSLLAFVIAAYFYSWVSKLPCGNKKIENVRKSY